jgi:Zn ribbon nucleic-acid-binding protein
VTAGPLLEQSGIQQGVNVGGSPTDRLGCTPYSSLFEYLRKRQNFNLVECLKRGYEHKEKSKQKIRTKKKLLVGQNQQLFLNFRV